MKNNKGFTLIELLIAVLMIAILSGTILVLINPLEIRKKARDAQRVSDLKQIQIALEQYYLKYRGYPVTGTTSSAPFIRISNSNGSTLYEALVDNGNSLLDAVPLDPLNTGSDTTPCANATNYRYNYKAVPRTGSTTLGDAYILTSIMESKTSNDGFECGALLNWGNSCTGSVPSGATCPDNPVVDNGNLFPTCDVCYGLENR